MKLEEAQSRKGRSEGRKRTHGRDVLQAFGSVDEGAIELRGDREGVQHRSTGKGQRREAIERREETRKTRRTSPPMTMTSPSGNVSTVGYHRLSGISFTSSVH